VIEGVSAADAAAGLAEVGRLLRAGPAWPFGDLVPGGYGTLVVDAPWAYHYTQRLGGRGRRQAGPGRTYSTLSIDELAALPVGELAGQRAHLWLWCTNKVLATGAHAPLLEAWGFDRAITMATWCKQGQPGIGTYLRGSTEHAVLAVRGWGTTPDVPWPSTWWLDRRRAHSVKPPSFGDIVERVSPGPYVELFARQQRLGWDSWGWGHETHG
jgi:N6-adenosine-specific RNA methylase IME4